MNITWLEILKKYIDTTIEAEITSHLESAHEYEFMESGKKSRKEANECWELLKIQFEKEPIQNLDDLPWWEIQHPEELHYLNKIQNDNSGDERRDNG